MRKTTVHNYNQIINNLIKRKDKFIEKFMANQSRLLDYFAIYSLTDMYCHIPFV